MGFVEEFVDLAFESNRTDMSLVKAEREREFLRAWKMMSMHRTLAELDRF